MLSVYLANKVIGVLGNESVLLFGNFLQSLVIISCNIITLYIRKIRAEFYFTRAKDQIWRYIDFPLMPFEIMKSHYAVCIGFLKMSKKKIELGGACYRSPGVFNHDSRAGFVDLLCI
jgi:fumarate reductase subunit C